jgi:hypothetical protein
MSSSNESNKGRFSQFFSRLSSRLGLLDNQTQPDLQTRTAMLAHGLQSVDQAKDPLPALDGKALEKPVIGLPGNHLKKIEDAVMPVQPPQSEVLAPIKHVQGATGDDRTRKSNDGPVKSGINYAQAIGIAPRDSQFVQHFGPEQVVAEQSVKGSTPHTRFQPGDVVAEQTIKSPPPSFLSGKWKPK